jgi:D-glycero-D-manno-heptose 1,7-bisphosphate phosphatase
MKLVLIDRDGVINEELPHYVKSVEELVVPEPALEGLALLKKQGFTCVIITNQSVVGRGIITDAMLTRIHNHLREAVASHGGEISDIFACTDRPDEATYRRKPSPGMLIDAMEKYKAAPEKTPFIGDATTDMQAAFDAGCPRYLVMTGKGRQTAQKFPDALRPAVFCNDLLDAARRIVENYR